MAMSNSVMAILLSWRQTGEDDFTPPATRQSHRCKLSGSPPRAAIERTSADGSNGRVEDGRGRLGHAATRRFPSPLVEPDVPITGIRLSDWLHREAHNGTVRGRRSRRSRPSPP